MFEGNALIFCRQPSVSLLVSPTINILSDEMEKESQKVRSMYEQPSVGWEDEEYANGQSNIGAVLANGKAQRYGISKLLN